MLKCGRLDANTECDRTPYYREQQAIDTVYEKQVIITGRLTKGILVKTTIYLANDILVAEREDGLRLSHTDAVQLANLLWENDVTSSEVFMIDWHEDAERAPLSGQKVAFYQRLRLHEKSLEQRTTN